MILYMKRQIIVLGMAVAASACFMRVSSAAPDKVIQLQDENFFLQDEIKKLQAELIDKDNAIKKILLERETARYDLGLAVQEKETLEDKVASLHKMIVARDEEFPRQVELAAKPYRSQMEEAVGQLKVMTIALEEKNARFTALMKEIDALKQKNDVLFAEKTSLLQSLKKIDAEYAAFKTGIDGQILDVKAGADQRVKDFQVRLAAEQTLVEEKIALARKPLEEKIAALSQDVRRQEERVSLLRETSANEIRKIEASAAAEMKGLKDQLDACHQAVKK